MIKIIYIKKQLFQYEVIYESPFRCHYKMIFIFELLNNDGVIFY